MLTVSAKPLRSADVISESCSDNEGCLVGQTDDSQRPTGDGHRSPHPAPPDQNSPDRESGRDSDFRRRCQMEHLALSNFARPGNAIRAVSMNPRWSNCSFSLLRHRCSIKVRSDNLHPVLGGLAIHPTRRWKLRALPSIDSTCSAAAAAEAVRSKYVNQRLSSSPSTTTTLPPSVRVRH